MTAKRFLERIHNWATVLGAAIHIPACAKPTYITALLLTAPLAAAEPALDPAHLDWVEDRTEDLANQLHELSLNLRDSDFEKLAEHFSPALAARGWPAEKGAPIAEIKWLYRQNTAIEPHKLDRPAFIKRWQYLLEGLPEIEDVRFKVKEVLVHRGDPVRAEAKVAFFLIGRDRQQGRHWIQGRSQLEANQTAGDRWQIDRFYLKVFSQHFVQTELFSEVSAPAKVYRAAPSFGSPTNQGFVAHGVAVADVDRDGLLDVFATGIGENYLYLNQGDGTFADGAQAAGLQITPAASGPLFLDSDNDGDSDLFLAAAGNQLLFENRLVPDGKLEFVDISTKAGVDRPAHGFSALSADVNRDGLPDIYVTSYNRYGLVMPNSWSRATNGTPNLLFINQGDGTFAERAKAWGLADSRWSYAAQFGDLDADGQTDVYVANDFGENGFYINRGHRFDDLAATKGLLDPGNGMGVSLGDYDNDGLLDIHVTNMSSTAGKRILKGLFPAADSIPGQTKVLYKLASGNTVFKNLGNGAFQDVSAAIGPFSAGWAWGGGFVDFDNDGWSDLHTPNGFISGQSLKDT